MATLIKADGTTATVKPANGKKKFSLAELQGYVAGYIELVHCAERGRHMYVNEDGRGLDLPFNHTATALMASWYGPGSFILGDAILMDKGEG